MNRHLLTAAIVSGISLFTAAANAQLAPVQLEVRLVPQSGTLPGAITDGNAAAPISYAPGTGATPHTVRMEVQYRIRDNNRRDTITPAGLRQCQFNIGCWATPAIGSTTTGPVAMSLVPARLSRSEGQAWSMNPPASIDISGTALGGISGVHAPFRDTRNTAGGLAYREGYIATDGIYYIRPFCNAINYQGDWARGLSDSAWYGLYSFDVTLAASGRCNINVGVNFAGIGSDRPGFNDVGLTGFDFYNHNGAAVRTSTALTGTTFTFRMNQVAAPTNGSTPILR